MNGQDLPPLPSPPSGIAPPPPSTRKTKSLALDELPPLPAPPEQGPPKTGPLSRFAGGVRESAGIPSWSEVMAWAHRVRQDPTGAAKRGGKEVVALAEYAWNHPGMLIYQMTNDPLLRQAWEDKDYARGYGIVAGTIAQLPLLAMGEGVAAKSARALKAGLAGKGIEAARSAERAERAATLGGKVTQAFKQGMASQRAETTAAKIAAKAKKATPIPAASLRISKAEMPSHPYYRGYQHAIGTTLFAGQPFTKLAEERQALLLNLPSRFAHEARNEERAAKVAYHSVEKSLGEKEGILKALQDQRSELLKDAATKMRRGESKEAAELVKQADAVNVELDKLMSKDPRLRSMFDRANRHYARYSSLRAVTDALNESFKGLRPEETLPQLAKESQTVKAGGLLEKLHDLENDRTEALIHPERKGRNRLVEALGPERATYVKNVAGKLATLQKKGGLSYWAIRVIGEGVLSGFGMIAGGTLGHGALGFLTGLGVGAVGARALSAYLVRSGTTIVMDNLLRSAFAGDMKETFRLARQLGEEQGKLIAKDARTLAEASVGRSVEPEKMTEAVKAVIEGTDPDVFAGQQRAAGAMKESAGTATSPTFLAAQKAKTVQEAVAKRRQLANMLRFLSGSIDPSRVSPESIINIEHVTGVDLSAPGGIERARQALKSMLKQGGKSGLPPPPRRSEP